MVILLLKSIINMRKTLIILPILVMIIYDKRLRKLLKKNHRLVNGLDRSTLEFMYGTKKSEY
jgi:hypothetical protein